MPIRWDVKEHVAIARYIVRWLALASPTGVVVGSIVALFLWALDEVTASRWQHPALLYALPLAGIAIVVSYRLYGRNSESGNNLIVEQIHEPDGGVPLRMAPLVLVATVVTHLFGGSAGREGTAVQIGGSISQALGKLFGLGRDEIRILLECGVAAGFGSVFGTPLTGAVFALEVVALGRIRYDALIPCLIASVVGDMSCQAWGIEHQQYRIKTALPELEHIASVFNGVLFLKVIIASFAFGLVSFFFAEITHTLQGVFKKTISRYWLRPVVGGVIVIVLAKILGTNDYLGLGITSQNPMGVSIVSAFREGGVTPWSWLWKLLFTAVTLRSGFKGGEVTPLFFIGATLGAALGALLGVPVDLMAGLGFVAVFAGATNTPLACTIMGVELFGSTYLIYFATACLFSYLMSGHSGIYLSQRIDVAKGGYLVRAGEDSLRAVRIRRESLLSRFYERTIAARRGRRGGSQRKR